MPSSTTCDHGKTAPDAAIAALPNSQANPGRHKCPTCAYDQGYRDGLAAAQKSSGGSVMP